VQAPVPSLVSLSTLTMINALAILDNLTIIGTLPSQWSALRNIAILSVSHNALASLSGTLPASWCVYLSVSTLGVMNMLWSYLTSSLPPQCPAIKHGLTLDITDNMMTGTIPAGYAAANIQVTGLPTGQAFPPPI
jgi:hypothetical protein